MAIFNDLTVQVTQIDGVTYRLVETVFGCPVLARVDAPGFWFLTDDDTLSRPFAERWQCLQAAENYRAAVDAAGGEPVDFQRECYVARNRKLSWRAMITNVVRGEGVVGQVYGSDGELSGVDVTVDRVSLLPADLLGAGIVTTAEAALQRRRDAIIELAAADAALGTLGSQLSDHASAIEVPHRADIDEATRVQLESDLQS